jgi:hypothetical protein
MDLRSKADLRREVERLESLVDKLEGARVAQEELIERLMDQIQLLTRAPTCTDSLQGVGTLLLCSLPVGHEGRHRSEDGAEWWREPGARAIELQS